VALRMSAGCDRYVLGFPLPRNLNAVVQNLFDKPIRRDYVFCRSEFIPTSEFEKAVYFVGRNLFDKPIRKGYVFCRSEFIPTKTSMTIEVGIVRACLQATPPSYPTGDPSAIPAKATHAPYPHSASYPPPTSYPRRRVSTVTTFWSSSNFDLIP